MGEPMRTDGDVIEIDEYLEDTLTKMDRAMADFGRDRQEIAVRIAALRAARDERVHEAADEYEAAVAAGRGYEAAEDVGDVLGEAHRRFIR